MSSRVSLYPGIPEQLTTLREAGYYLAVATCKPEYQAKPVCDHFHITELVDGIYGASTDNSRVDKVPAKYSSTAPDSSSTWSITRYAPCSTRSFGSA